MNKKQIDYYQRHERRILILALIAAALIVLLALIGVLVGRNHTLKQQLKDQKNTVQTVAQAGADASFSYQKLYPQLNVGDIPETEKKQDKVVYLTFDDGPSALTYQIMDILEKYHAKATFFLIGNNITESRKALLQRMARDGCTIGIHTESHDYKKIYASVDDFLTDYNEVYNKIYKATGTYPDIFRFPGGSINSYNKGYYQPLIAEMLRRGFVYFDWNISSEDATGKKYTSEELCNHVVSKVDAFQKTVPVVLFHDAANKKTTVQAVEMVLEKLSARGYTFGALERSTPQVAFAYQE